MVTRCQLQAEGFLLCSFSKSKGKKLNMIDMKGLKTGLGEIRSRIGSSLEEEEMIESQRPFGWPSKFLCVWVFERPVGV